MTIADLDRRNKFHLRSQKYSPAIPVREKNSQIAERKIFTEVTASSPVARIKKDSI